MTFTASEDSIGEGSAEEMACVSLFSVTFIEEGSHSARPIRLTSVEPDLTIP